MKQGNPKPLPWYGGKSGYGKANWIAGLIPWAKNSTYVEPFGGMAGVLLARQPTKCEIYNDLDGRIVNWWRVIREQSEEFAWRVQLLPHSEEEHQKAKRTICDPCASDMDRAVAFHCLALQSVAQNLSGNPAFIARFSHKTGSNGRWFGERVAPLAERFWNVQLFNRPAESILQKMQDRESAVIYCDPPYVTRDTSAYHVCDVDVPGLSELLSAQKGFVAISGTADEWDHLGWHRHTHKSLRRRLAWERKNSSPEFEEVLWTNQTPLEQNRLFCI